MGDYAHLVKIRKDDFMKEYHQENILICGKYMIPFIWTTIFSPGHVRERETESDLYDVLMIPTKEALTLAEERKVRFLNLFADPIENVYDKWLEILRGAGDCVLMLDINDMLGTSLGKDFDAELPRWAGALAGDNPDSLQFALPLGSLEWDEKILKVKPFDQKLSQDEIANWVIGAW